jgi:arabinan endo-1,5-alpha-L-arabinosidase
VGISHCGIFQQDGTGDWFYASQGRLPAGVNGNESSNALMMGHIRRIVWCPSSADNLNDLWPIALPERYAGLDNTKVTSAEIAGTWEHINLTYQQGVMDTAQTLTLASGGQMSGALTGTWTYDESSQYLTLAPTSGPKVVVVVAREADWEASPRQATLVYAGTEKSLDATWWGKKVK